MSKFKVGDIVEYMDDGERCVVSKVDSDGCTAVKTKNYGICWESEGSLKLIERSKPMSKYDELKGRINKLDNGWDKEADDIIEIMMIHKPVMIKIERHTGIDVGYIIIDKGQSAASFNLEKDVKFEYHSQRSKNSAFKKALLWLLDHSSIKNKKQERIEELESKASELRRQAKDLQQQIDQLKE